jgi:hypothetical protein
MRRGRDGAKKWRKERRSLCLFPFGFRAAFIAMVMTAGLHAKNTFSFHYNLWLFCLEIWKVVSIVIINVLGSSNIFQTELLAPGRPIRALASNGFAAVRSYGCSIVSR